MTTKENGEPSETVADGGLTIAGARFTVSVNDWVAGAPSPLSAVIVRWYTPVQPVEGVPAIDAVPSTLSVSVTPDGSVPGLRDERVSACRSWSQ